MSETDYTISELIQLLQDDSENWRILHSNPNNDIDRTRVPRYDQIIGILERFVYDSENTPINPDRYQAKYRTIDDGRLKKFLNGLAWETFQKEYGSDPQNKQFWKARARIVYKLQDRLGFPLVQTINAAPGPEEIRKKLVEKYGSLRKFCATHTEFDPGNLSKFFNSKKDMTYQGVRKLIDALN